MNGTVHGTALTGGSLSVNANADISGDLTAGETTINGGVTASGDVIGGGSIQCPNVAKFSPDGGQVDVKTTVQQANVNQGSLIVMHNAAGTNKPALDVTNRSTNASAIGVQVIAPVAISATGVSMFTGTTKFNGSSNFYGTASLDGNPIILGGSEATETRIRHANNRIEFLVGGTLRFYIDTTGGHNA